MELWLSVIDYAVVKKVSVSTLRRRIKAQLLETKIENGKYLIRVLKTEESFKSDNSTINISQDLEENSPITIAPTEPSTIQTLVQELKGAYSQALAEKEEMITQLKSEIEILKHMNRFLEHQIINAPNYSSKSFQNPDLI